MIRESLAAVIRRVVAERRVAAADLARASGVAASVVRRFLAGQRDLRLETAERLAASLGLVLVEPRRRAAPQRSAAATDASSVATRPRARRNPVRLGPFAGSAATTDSPTSSLESSGDSPRDDCRETGSAGPLPG